MALRYWVGGGSSANWNATGNTNWGTASGVQDNASVPTSVDDVIFDGAGAGGNTNSTISATITVKSLTINAGYTATMTHNAVLTIAGNWTMSNTHTIAGASGIILSGGTTIITSGGQTWPNDLTFSYSITYNTITLVGNFICGGTTIITGGYGKTVNKTTAETYTTKGITLTNGYIDGTAEKILSGGTWQGTGGAIGGLLTFDSGVNTTIISGVVTFNGTILKYTSGTVTTTASTLTLSAGTQTLNTSGITWNDVVCSFPSFASTITLTSNFVCTGTTTFSGGYSTAINKTASETWTSNGLVISGKSLSGTSEFILSGGTWSSTGLSVSINLTFAGNVTVSGNVYYLTGILKYTSGTVTTTGTTLNITGTCTLNANGITWNNVVCSSGTATLTSNFTCTGTTSVVNGFSPSINKTASETWSTNGITMPATGSLSGTVELVLTGGSWTSGGSFIFTDITFAGNVTVSGTLYYSTRTLKYTSGTVTTTGSTLRIGGNVTLNTDGITWNNLTIADNGTYTVASNFLCDGIFTVLGPLGSFALNRTASQTFVVNGGISLNNSTSGTAEITLRGGTWSASTNCYIGNNLVLDGNITLSGTVNYGYGSGDKTLKYLSGTITTTGSTLNLSGPYPSTMYLDTNGITWNNVTIIDNGIYTITSNFLCNGLFRMFQTLGAFSLNRTASQTFVVNGGLSLNYGISGTAEITLRGGTWSASLNCAVSNNLFLDGNITISGTVYFNGPGTLKYLSGTIITSSSTLSLSGGILSPYNVTLDTNGITWNNVTMGNNGNIVLNSDFLCNGLFTIIVGLGLFSFNRSASQVARFNGGISIGTGCSGTAQITLGGGTWSGTANVSNNLVIDGNVTISTGSGKYLTGTITGTTGTVTGTLLLQGACTFNCTGVNWGTLSFDAAATYTINSLLSASVIQPNINGVTFAGTAGWTCATYNHAATSAQSVTLKDGVTYTVTGALNAFQSRNASSISIASSSASLRANLVLLAGATCNCLANLTRIDASGGRPIYTFNGTVTDCVNVKAFNDLTTIASSYVNL